MSERGVKFRARNLDGMTFVSYDTSPLRFSVGAHRLFVKQPPHSSNLMSSVRSSQRTCVLLVEDNRLLRESLNAQIAMQADLAVIATWGTADDIVRVAGRVKPAIALIDLGLQRPGALALVDHVARSFGGVGQIVMNVTPGQIEVLEFVRAGASGFVMKDAALETLLQTIRLVRQGIKVLPRGLTGSLFSAIGGYRSRDRLFGPRIRLTRREHEISELIADGLSNKEIAQRLNVATFTVKTHVHNLLHKLAVQTRAQVASYVTTDRTGR